MAFWGWESRDIEVVIQGEEARWSAAAAAVIGKPEGRESIPLYAACTQRAHTHASIAVHDNLSCPRSMQRSR